MTDLSDTECDAIAREVYGKFPLLARVKHHEALDFALIRAGAAAAPKGPVAWRDVLAERERQVTAEGWTPEHDDAHQYEQMAQAAAVYALPDDVRVRNEGGVPLLWPWADRFWKPGDRRRELVKAGALILAEIERLDRAAADELKRTQQPPASRDKT